MRGEEGVGGGTHRTLCNVTRMLSTQGWFLLQYAIAVLLLRYEIAVLLLRCAMAAAHVQQDEAGALQYDCITICCHIFPRRQVGLGQWRWVPMLTSQASYTMRAPSPPLSGRVDSRSLPRMFGEAGLHRQGVWWNRRAPTQQPFPGTI